MKNPKQKQLQCFYMFYYKVNRYTAKTRPSVFRLKNIPGRTFLGKRRYFSGIVALTPLTPLTYKQNAVNAFIPTSKTPLTPLYRQGTPLTRLAFRLNAVNAVIPCGRTVIVSDRVTGS